MTYSIDRPSQAEGDRDTIEADLRRFEPGDATAAAEPPAAGRPRTAAADEPGYSLDKPSQAEGDRETIDAALRRREAGG